MASYAGTFSAVGNVTPTVNLLPSQGVVVTTTLTGSHPFVLILETSPSTIAWTQVARFTSDQAATVFLNNSLLRVFCRLRVDTIDTVDSETIAYTFADQTLERVSAIVNPLTGNDEIQFNDSGISVINNLGRLSQTYICSASLGCKVGATAGWVVAAAANTALVTLAQSQAASTLIIPISDLKPGWTITGFYLIGNVTSAGNTTTVDCQLRSGTAAAAGPTDALVASMTQVSVTANTILSSANAIKSGLTEVVPINKNYYLLITSTTAASTTQTLQAYAIIVTEL